MGEGGKAGFRHGGMKAQLHPWCKTFEATAQRPGRKKTTLNAPDLIRGLAVFVSGQFSQTCERCFEPFEFAALGDGQFLGLRHHISARVFAEFRVLQTALQTA